MVSNYLEIELRLIPLYPWREIMIAQMGSLGFESFVDTSLGFKGYIPKNDFQEKDFLKIDVFDTQDLKVEWNTKIIPPENWNRLWEKNYRPVKIGETCMVRGDFHPSENLDYELLINPKMSFGSGHHETTQMMISYLLELNCKNKSVLDMGTGTGVLAILAEKRGAKNILALDIDTWSVENSLENLELNNCQKITVELRNIVPKEKVFDMILANLNRNLLLKQIQDYAKALEQGGDIVISGFYVEDLVKIQKACEKEGFRFIRNLDLNNWVAAHFNLS